MRIAGAHALSKEGPSSRRWNVTNRNEYGKYQILYQKGLNPNSEIWNRPRRRARARCIGIP